MTRTFTLLRRGVLLTSVLAFLVVGCSTSSSVKGSDADEIVVQGEPRAIIENVIQWCGVHRLEVLNYGKLYLMAGIREYQFQDGSFIFADNCGVSAFDKPKTVLNDPRMKVTVEERSDQPGTCNVTVTLVARSEIGNCKSSGILEQNLFQYLRAESEKAE